MIDKDKPKFEIGKYRPIYLWAGPGTVRMNRLKFMDVAVDEGVHAAAHTPEGARRVVQELYCNWVHLTYDWGFPPEVEQEDWESFRQAAEAYHQAGSPVFAYIQSSNCVYEGSFRDQDWYALDPRGRRITYFTYGGRYMACFSSPEWREHLKEMIRGAVTYGADGIFLDNLFHGAQPMSMSGAWLGSAGCYCRRCRQVYQQAYHEALPDVLGNNLHTARYLRWRATQVVELVTELADYARELKPGIPLAANDFDPVLRNSYLVYGIDLEELAHVQDVTLIENYGLPRWELAPRPRLANNALTVRTARALVNGSAHLNVLSYDVGIGFDGVYPQRRYLQGIAEAAALGVSMTTKGTEYHDGQKMTLLTADEYTPVRTAIGGYHRWLEAHAELFVGQSEQRRNLAPVGLLYPGEALWLDWQRLAPLYFGAGQALTLAGIPWRVMRSGDVLDGLCALLVFDNPGLQAASGVEISPDAQKVPIVWVPGIAGWQLSTPSFIARHASLRSAAGAVVKTMLKAYSQYEPVRWMADKVGLQKIVTQSPLYCVPPDAVCKALLAALPTNLYPRLQAAQPVLIEAWQDETGMQVHLVNYDAQPQHVSVAFGRPVSGRWLSPEAGEGACVAGNEIEMDVDIYKILTLSGTI